MKTLVVSLSAVFFVLLGLQRDAEMKVFFPVVFSSWEDLMMRVFGFPGSTWA